MYLATLHYNVTFAKTSILLSTHDSNKFDLLEERMAVLVLEVRVTNKS